MIPEAAIDELLKAISLNIVDFSSREVARLALEAAAPHMLAEAWDACANLPSRPRPEDNPYRPTL